MPNLQSYVVVSEQVKSEIALSNTSICKRSKNEDDWQDLVVTGVHTPTPTFSSQQTEEEKTETKRRGFEPDTFVVMLAGLVALAGTVFWCL